MSSLPPAVLTFTILAAALGLALITGRNDGAALVAMGAGTSSLRPKVAVAVIACATALVPALIGAPVATTLAHSLVDFGSSTGGTALLAALIGTFLAVLVPALVGLSTSVTLALIGATIGAGLGSGHGVSWTRAGFVLVMGALAPAVAGLLAVGVGRIVRLASGHLVARSLDRMQLLSFLLLCLAYGLNDGQKVLAVLALSTGSGVTEARGDPLIWLAVAVTMVAGMAIGLRKAVRTISRAILPQRPLQNLVNQTAAALTIIGGGLLGAPMSMTQSIVGAIVGSGIDSGWRRIRWGAAGRLGLTWLATLPTAVAGAAVVSRVLQGLSL
jgi:PiT family inorganic phosphate transporter